jgi:hypothetical protein
LLEEISSPRLVSLSVIDLLLIILSEVTESIARLELVIVQFASLDDVLTALPADLSPVTESSGISGSDMPDGN